MGLQAVALVKCQWVWLSGVGRCPPHAVLKPPSSVEGSSSGSKKSAKEWAAAGKGVPQQQSCALGTPGIPDTKARSDAGLPYTVAVKITFSASTDIPPSVSRRLFIFS